MNQMHKSLGRLPYHYTAESDLNDYQVTINGPVGRAIITALDGGDTYEVETAFDGQSARRYAEFGSPVEALDWIVTRSEFVLLNRGVAPPPRVDPRPRRYAVLLAAVLAVLATLAVLAAFGASDSDSRTPPAPSFTTAPGGTR